MLQVYKAEDVNGEVIVELDVTWAGQQNVQLVIKPFPKFHLGVGLGVGKLVSNFLTMRVGVGNLFFSGRVRLSLKPLMGRLPVVGAVRVSFVEQPHFNYALTVYGGDISFLPGGTMTSIGRPYKRTTQCTLLHDGRRQTHHLACFHLDGMSIVISLHSAKVALSSRFCSRWDVDPTEVESFCAVATVLFGNCEPWHASNRVI